MWNNEEARETTAAVHGSLQHAAEKQWKMGKHYADGGDVTRCETSRLIWLTKTSQHSADFPFLKPRKMFLNTKVKFCSAVNWDGS